MIHHGMAGRSRRLEMMIEMMDFLDSRFTLDFMLVETDKAYMKELRELASGDPRIRFVAPVGMLDICGFINGYDIGVYLLSPSNFNQAYALPNKIFEFVQARLGVAIGPSLEMARLVNEYGFGVVSESFEPRDLASRLMALSAEDIERFKVAAHNAALELSYERDGAVFLEEVERLL